MNSKEKLHSYEISQENIETGISCFDYALSGGIIPGSTIQIVGESGTGKTTLCLRIAKNLCEKDKKVLYLDAEGSVTQTLLNSIGITNDLIDDNFYYIKESTFKEAEEALDKYINSIKFDLVIVDSLAALINEDFLNVGKSASITTNNSNLNSKPLTLFLMKYNAMAKKEGTSFILINQYRNKVDFKIGTILKEYGGKSVRYNSDIILKIQMLKATGKNKDFKKIPQIIPGNMLELEIIKSNKSIPGLTFPLYLIYGHGPSEVYSRLYALLSLNLIKDNNNYYQYEHGGVCHRRHGFAELYEAFTTMELDKEVMSKIKDFYTK